ncbi:MAG: hypothetical protein ACJ796_21050 [Gemmatimonadaceae bacterium]
MHTPNESTVSGPLGSVRAVTGNVQATLADKLEAGAEVIRDRFDSGSPNAEGLRGRLGAAGGAVAEQLEGSALWLRENDITDLRDLVAKQLKEHPGRSALVALGLGILIGRSSRR